MKRAVVVVDLDMATAGPARTTHAITSASGVSGFSLEASSGFDESTSELEKMRFRLPLADAEHVIAEIRLMPGVIDARIAEVHDYPPDDEPPSGVREPRRPLPPTGHQSEAIEEP